MTGVRPDPRQGRRGAAGGAPPTAPATAATVHQSIRVGSGFGYGVVGADLHVFPDRGPVHLLGEHQGAAPARDGAWLLHRPSRMLNARYRLVDFTGRERERAELADEAFGITTRLAAADPVRYEGTHARVLRQSARARLDAGGDLAAARRDADLSVALYRRPAAENRAEHSRGLEEALETQESVGRTDSSSCSPTGSA